jgi:hypothetical protein
MRPGGGKAKGASFEREICVKLSLWVSGGKNEDLFWRSAMSGGRATVAHKSRGAKLDAHAGDITSTHEDGHVLTNAWYIECKRYNDLQYASFMLKGIGKLAQFWEETCEQAVRHDKMPMLIAREDRGATTILVARCTYQAMHNALGDLYMLSAKTRIATVYPFQVQIHDFEKVMAEPFVARKLPQGARWLRPGEDPFAITYVADTERRRPQRQQRKPQRQERA